MKNIDVLEYLPSGIMIIDNEFNPVLVNSSAKKIFEIELSDFKEELNSERFKRFKNIIQTAIDKDFSIDRVEVEILNKNNLPLTIGFSVKIIDENTVSKKYLIIFRNITEIIDLRKEVELQKRLSMLGQMAAGVSHELRNPLSSIRGLIELSLLKLRDEKIIKNLEIALSEVDTINNIITDVLNFAKPWLSDIREIEIHYFLDNIIENEMLYLKDDYYDKINIIRNYAPDLQKVLIDREALKVIFNNIFINSVHSLDGVENPEIIITTKFMNNMLKIEIKDNGVGITDEDKEQIFTPFFSTKVGKGTGLGLTIVKKIIDTIKGKLYFESVRGQGTTFNILLPCNLNNED